MARILLDKDTVPGFTWKCRFTLGWQITCRYNTVRTKIEKNISLWQIWPWFETMQIADETTSLLAIDRNVNLFESSIWGRLCWWQCRRSCWYIGWEALHEKHQKAARCMRWIQPLSRGNNSRVQAEPGQTLVPWSGWERWRQALADWWQTLSLAAATLSLMVNLIPVKKMVDLEEGRKN